MKLLRRVWKVTDSVVEKAVMGMALTLAAFGALAFLYAMGLMLWKLIGGGEG